MIRLLGLLLVTFFGTASVALAGGAPPVVVDIHGEVHGLGYIPIPIGDHLEARVAYWQPTAAQVAELPDEYDSEALGFVSPIKDQKACGSCWDFAITKALESAILASGAPFQSLSEQDVLFNDHHNAWGCAGGTMDATFWLDKTQRYGHGVASTAACPYKANDRVACRAPAVAHASAWGFIGAAGRAPTVDELRAAVVEFKVFPVTVAAANDGDWAAGGVFSGCRTRGVNHMVDIVGYKRLDDGRVQFKVANSWSARWGTAGYFFATQGCDDLASTSESAMFVRY